MIGAIGGLFGKMFGTEKALNSVVDGAASALDKLIYTDEEKADAATASRTEARKMIIEWMKTTKGQNLARRFIALSITGVWLFQYLIAWALDFVAVFTNDVGTVTSTKLTEAAMLTAQRADGMTGAMMLILGFYFAAPHMGDIAKTALKRFGGGSKSTPG